MSKPILNCVFALCICLSYHSNLFGYWATGHHVIAVLAYELLESHEREELLRILESHPRFEADFEVPESIRHDEAASARWRIGAAGYWPDVIRSNPQWDRPTWHYQLGASLALGDVEVPEERRHLPPNATLESQDLYLTQALALCIDVLADRQRSDADRAVALCWIAHLVADSHQPCHAGSLYTERAFPDGDRGANSIKLSDGNNLHAIWDSLLGRDLTPNNVRRRVHDLMSDPALVVAGTHACDEPGELNPEHWIEEGRRLSVQYVYAGEVRTSIEHLERGLTDELEPVSLSDEYLKRAGRVSELRAVEAGHRLASILSRALKDEQTE